MKYFKTENDAIELSRKKWTNGDDFWRNKNYDPNSLVTINAV